MDIDSCRMAMHVSSRGSDSLTLVYGGGVNSAEISLPGSKSIAARALILAFIYKYKWRNNREGSIAIEVVNEPECDDTDELKRALRQLTEWVKTGSAYQYDLGSGGTSMRFFLALVASLPGFKGIIDCSEAMRHRPITPLLTALREAGAYIEGDSTPFKVKGRRFRGGDVKVDQTVSSQFVSALMMASLLWEHPWRNYTPAVVSRPYIEMTRRVMESFESMAESSEKKIGQNSENLRFVIEGDWSAASYYYEFALLNPGIVVGLRNLSEKDLSLQGDSRCLEIFGQLGVRSERVEENEGNGYDIYCVADKVNAIVMNGYPVEFNLNDEPDLAPALAVGLCMAGIRFSISGIEHLRYKESDRIDTLKTELANAGYLLRSESDKLVWDGAVTEVINERNPVFDSHNDHRIAMALAMAATRFDSVTITGAKAITKSYSKFISDINKLGILDSIQ